MRSKRREIFGSSAVMAPSCPLHQPLRGRALYPSSPRPGAEHFLEEAPAAQLDTRVVALESVQDPRGFLEGLPAHDEAIQLIEIEAQTLIEGAQRASMDAQQRLGIAQAAGANRAAIGHREGHLASAPT